MAETATPAKADTGTGTETPAAQKPTGEPKPGEPKPAATATATKPDADTPKPASKDDAATPQSKAPEKYALTLPDGGRVDETDLATIETVAREQGWSNDEAQARVAAHAAAVEAQSARFEADTKADPVYGGAHLEETLKHVKTVVDKVRKPGTPERAAFDGLLNKSGYGNNLQVVSFLADLGKMMAEDSGAAQTVAGSATARNPADVLYDAPVK